MLLIRNGTIHTMAGTTLPKTDLLVEGCTIKDIAKSIDAPVQKAEIINADGLQIYPGFIDAHSHIGISQEKLGEDGNDCNEYTNPITPCMRAIDAINPMDSAFHNAVASGITSAMVGPGSANVIGGQFAFVKLYGRDISRTTVLAPAAMKIAFGENPKKQYGANNSMPATRMAIASLLHEALFHARAYNQARKMGGPDFQPDFMQECYVPLLDGIIPLKAHVHRADDILTAIRIAQEFNVGLTLDHCTEGHLIPAEIAESGFPAIVGPCLAARSKIEVCHSDFKTAGILHKAGVLVALTTDHPVSRLQYLPLCAALAAKEGLGRDEALAAITINAAQICRVDHRVGSLVIGKDADIVITDGDPLEIFTKALYTIIDGKIVYQHS